MGDEAPPPTVGQVRLGVEADDFDAAVETVALSGLAQGCAQAIRTAAVRQGIERGDEEILFLLVAGNAVWQQLVEKEAHHAARLGQRAAGIAL